MILEIPENTVEQTEMEPSELLLEFAVFLFQQKKLNLAKAARLANLSEKDFQKVLVARQFTLEDLEPKTQAAKNGKRELRQPGWGKDFFKYVAPDFDEDIFEPTRFYKSVNVDLTNFKFDREEANER